MTPAEEADLRALGMDLTRSMQSQWEPACVARAFASTGKPPTFVLTMQAWINLDAIHSPVLQGQPPDTLEAFEAALQAFGYDDPVSLTVEESVALAELMVDAMVDGFAMFLKMTTPQNGERSSAADGFGLWLPIYAALVGQFHLDPTTVLAMPVGRAFALLAAHRHNHGWQVAGRAYSQRDLEHAEDQLPEDQ